MNQMGNFLVDPLDYLERLPLSDIDTYEKVKTKLVEKFH